MATASCTAPRKAPANASVPLAPTVGGSGAFAVVSVGGRQKLYLPEFSSPATGHAAIAVVDVGAAGDGTRGAPALVTDIDLGAGDGVEYATTTAGDSTLVVAASTESPSIWFIDPATDTLLGRTRLDASFGQSDFGGDGGYVTSVAMDPAHGRAILAVWNGFALLDLSSRKITRVVEVPPSENFALDPIHERIVAPFYDCASSMNTTGQSLGRGDVSGCPHETMNRAAAPFQCRSTPFKS